MTCFQRRACILTAGLFIAALVGPSVSQGQTGRGVPWIGPDLGNWTVIANWDNFGFGQPLREFAEEGIINNNTTVIVNTAVNDSTPPPPISGGTSSTTGGVVVGGAFTSGTTTTRGNGGLMIQSGGALNVQSGVFTNSQNVTLTSSGNLVAGLTAAAAPNPVTTGTVTVNTGGSLTVGNSLILGQAGVGNMTTQAGTTVNAGSVTLGVAGSGNGTLTQGGALTVTNQMVIGQAGTGALTLQNGSAVNVTNNVQVGQTGRGTLTIPGGASLTAGRLNLGGTGGATPSTITLGDASGLTATLTSNGPTSLLRTTRITGPNVNFTSQGPLTLPSSQTLIADIRHASNHSPIMTPSSASVDGTLKIEFTGVTPTFGNTWSIIDANSISGTFRSIDASGAPALGPGQSYQTIKVAGGVNGQLLKLAVEEMLTLQVNRQTGAMSIKNIAPATHNDIVFDGYTILSGHGGLSAGTWNSLTDQAFAGWQEAPASANSLSELCMTGSTNVGGGESLFLGSPYTAMFPAFQVDPDDVTFEYTTSNGVRQGFVEYIGTKVQNNLVLTVNPTTGAATLKNDSPFALSIEGYSILSSSGALRPANGQWNSLTDQGTPNWTEAAPTANALSELAISGSLALPAQTTFNLGTLFTPGGAQDLSLEFLLLDDPDAVNGVVLYESAVGGLAADFDNNNVVNGADLTVWRNNFGPGNANADADNDGDSDGNDFLVWQRQLGQSAAAPAAGAVPEPSSLLLSLLAGVFFCRQSRRQKRENSSSEVRTWSVAMLSLRLKPCLAMAFASVLACFALIGAAPARGADVLLVGGQLGSSDEELVTLLKSLGHTVVNEESFNVDGSQFFGGVPSAAQLAGVDVILFSRTAVSTEYDDAGEPAAWNALSKPLILLNSASVRGGSATNGDNRWGWMNATEIISGAPAPTNFDPYPNPSHPFVVGRTTDVFPPNQTIDYINSLAIPFGTTMVAQLTIPTADGPVPTPGIVDYPAGTTLFADAQGAVNALGGRRVFFQLFEYPDTTDVFALSTNGGMILDQILNTLGGTASSRAGDVDGDGDVDINDFNVIKANFRTSVASRTLGDLTGDGFVDLADFRQWKDNDLLAATAAAGAVPEPAGWALAALGVAVVSAARRRRSVSNSLPQSGEASNVNAEAIRGSGETLNRMRRGTVRIGRLATIAALAAGVAMGGGEAMSANIAWVSFHAGDDAPSQAAIDEGYTQAPDVGYTNLLTTAGHNVTRFVTVNDVNTNTALIDQLNAPAIDLVMISRSVDSGHYQAAAEATTWNNTITKPMMILGGYVLRQSRLGFMGNETIPDTTGPVKLTTAVPGHPIFAGIALDGSNTMVNDYSTAIPVLNTAQNPNAPQRGISVNELPIDNDGAGGTLLASLSVPISAGGNLVVAEWTSGTSITKDTGAQSLSNRRLAFLTGSREQGSNGTSQQSGMFDLAPDGQTMFLNAVAYMGGPGFQPGDVDKDGDVDLNDFNAIRDNFQQSATMREEGDLTGDGFVDWRDFRQWKDNHPFTPPPAAAANAAVPEPAGILLGLISLAAIAGGVRSAGRRALTVR